MKLFLRYVSSMYLWLFCALVMLPTMLLAAEGDPAPAPVVAFNIWSYVIAIVGPVLVLQVKKWFPHIPNVVLPYLAVALGPVLDLLLGLLPVYEANPSASVAIGLAIIGARELWDQTQQARAGTGGTPAESAAYEAKIKAAAEAAKHSG